MNTNKMSCKPSSSLLPLSLPDNYKPVLELIHDTDELWRYELGVHKKPAGNYALVTNKGVFLMGGIIKNTGQYVTYSDVLIENEPFHKKMQFLFSFGRNDMSAFQDRFETILCDHPKRSWKKLENLFLSAQGQTLKDEHDFKLHSIININRGGAGISLDKTSDSVLGRSGIIYCVNEKSLVMVVNNKILKI